MKGNGIERDTLDGVITALEKVDDTWQNGRNGLQYADLRDALHYLRQLQLFRQTPLMQGIHKAQKEYSLYPVEDWGEENLPLTWDELKQMEGKPVWVEGEHGCIWDQKSWVLIRLDNENEDLIICVATNNGHYEFAIGKEDYGKDWQAYRKEKS